MLMQAQRELEKYRQPQTPTKRDTATNKAQFFGQNLSETPPHTSHKAAQVPNGSLFGNACSYGPPPIYPLYGSSLQMPRRPSSGSQTPERRSDTWHEHNTRTDVTPGSPSESLFPPTAVSYGALRKSPPQGTYPAFQKRAHINPTGSDETATGPAGRLWHHTNALSPCSERA